VCTWPMVVSSDRWRKSPLKNRRARATGNEPEYFISQIGEVGKVSVLLFVGFISGFSCLLV
jgi:hypothetical protein